MDLKNQKTSIGLIYPAAQARPKKSALLAALISKTSLCDSNKTIFKL
jgi:hypothetical protein